MLDVNWLLFAGVLILNSLAAQTIVMFFWPKRSAPGGKAMIFMFCGLAIWTFSYAMITLSSSFAVKVFWLKIENLGIVSTPLAWFLFSLQYTKRMRWLSRPTLALLVSIPLVSLFLIFSGRWTSLYYADIRFLGPEGVGPLVIKGAGWYILQLVESYSFILGGMGLLIWHTYQFQDGYRRQLYSVLGAIIIPWLLNAFYQLGPRLFPAFYFPVDLSPIAFTFTAALISVSVFGLRLLDMVPIARSTVMENISEMVLVVDARNRVLDANSAARRWLRKTSAEIIGSPITDVFKAWPELKSHYENPAGVREEVQIYDDRRATFELIISPLYNMMGVLEGRVIVAHDITEHKKLETELQQANDALKEKLAEVELLQVELREQAIRDSLTGVYNRRFLSQVLDGEVARAERSSSPISVAMLDVDHFKQFNDRYGHKCGDEVLKFLANLLTSNTRRSDVVCRYGGEEFVVLMPDATLEAARQRAESWQHKLVENPFQYGAEKLPISFSVGVASFPLNGMSGEAVLHIADQALYESKAHGRNLVTVYHPAE